MRIARALVMLFIVASFMAGCDLRYGFVESEFTLADTSRLPRWFQLEPMIPREKLVVSFTYYTGPFGHPVKMELKEKESNKLIKKLIGEHRWHPLSIQQGHDKKPSYSIITVNHVWEVIEQKKLEPILYISDDASLLNQITPN